MSCNAIGAATQIIVQGGALPRTFTDSSEFIPFIAEDIGNDYGWSGRGYGVGDIMSSSDAYRIMTTTVTGTLNLLASPEELHRWLPRAMWGTVVGNTYETGNLPSNYTFDVAVHRDSRIFRYSDCQVNKIRITSQASNGGTASEIATLDVEIVGTVEYNTGLTWPSPAPTVSDGLNELPYMHFESYFTVGGSSIPLEQWSLEIDNQLRPVRMQQQSVAKWRSRGRRITFGGVGVFTSDTIDDAISLISTPTNCVLALSHTSAPMSTQFQLANCRNIGWQTPRIRNRSHVPLQFTLTPGTTGTAELIVVNDHAP